MLYEVITMHTITQTCFNLLTDRVHGILEIYIANGIAELCQCAPQPLRVQRVYFAAITVDEIPSFEENQLVDGIRMVEDSFRITSYNVCYTKLLRAAGARRGGGDAASRAGRRPRPLRLDGRGVD